MFYVSLYACAKKSIRKSNFVLMLRNSFLEAFYNTHLSIAVQLRSFTTQTKSEPSKSIVAIIYICNFFIITIIILHITSLFLFVMQRRGDVKKTLKIAIKTLLQKYYVALFHYSILRIFLVGKSDYYRPKSTRLNLVPQLFNF